MIRLTREIRFSASTPDEKHESIPTLNSWAGSLARGVAPFLCLRATVEGQLSETGYLCDIKVIDDLLRQRAAVTTTGMLAEYGNELSPEMVLKTLWHRIPESVIPGVRVIALQLVTSPYISYTIERDNPSMIQLTEQFEFSAAHRLHCEQLTAEENKATFGKCNNPNGHGHNYVVEVTVANPEPETGLSRRLDVQRVVNERVIDRFDHKHLNKDTEEFRTLNPTVENIAKVVWDLLVDSLKPTKLVSVRVYETPKTWADYAGAR
ncbi:MAG: 6-carboxytetrahydropterin synthase [Gemmataceae bacterium]